MFSEDTMDISFSATERGYLSDVSNAASPSGKSNTTNHNRRRIKHSDSNIHRIINGSVTDTDDDNNNVRLCQFERKPPKSKSSRKHTEQHSLEETKLENRSYSSYNDHKKRFSWTDSGISSSIGTGPHTRKSLYSEPLPTSVDHTENMPENGNTPLLKNIVGDTCNAVNELKDLQKSFRKAHLEHDSCKIANTNTIITNPLESVPQEVKPPPDVTVTEENKKNDSLDKNNEKKKYKIEKKENKRRHSNYIGFENGEKYFDTRNTKKFNGGDIKRDISCDRTTTKSKGFLSGLRKVASHFKPTFLMNTQSKDVTAEFSFAKRKNDEDTLKELQTITSRFRNEVNHLHNVSIENYGLDETKLQLDEENIQNILLEKLAIKPTKNMTFIQKVFSRSRSYKAKPFKKNNKRKSLCEHVFISPCYADAYSPSISNNNNHNNNNNNHIYRSRTNSRKRIHCSLSTEEYVETPNRTLSPNEEEIHIEKEYYSFSSKEGACLRNNSDGLHARYIIDQQDIRPQGSNNKQLFRVHSLSYMREPDDSHNIHEKSQLGRYASTNISSVQQLNMDLQQHVYSYSSSDVHTINNCEQYSECEECVYSDYLDYLKFRRHRRSSRCDVYCRCPHETHDDNGYGSYTDHHCQCGSQNEQLNQYNGDILSENNKSEFPCGEVERNTIVSEPNDVKCELEEETSDTKYGTYV